MDNPRDIVTMRINEVRAMLLAATSESFLQELHECDQEYYLYGALRLIDEAIEAQRRI